MRKLTILGLSLLLSVGAFAQAQLKAPYAQKQSASKAEQTEQTPVFQTKIKSNTRSVRNNVPGIVVQKSGTSRALIAKSAKSKANAAVTTDKIYAGMIYPQAMLGAGKINVTSGAYTPIVKAAAGAHSVGVNPDLSEIYLISYNSSSTGVSSISVGAYDLTTGAVKRSRTISSQEEFDVFIQRGAYDPVDNAFYGFCNNGWAKLDCNTLESSLLKAYDSVSEIMFSGYTYNSNTGTIVAGKFYTTGTSQLYTIDKATGAGTKLADVNVTSQYIGGFGYDYSSNSYLYNPNDDYVSEIVSIDANTYAVTTLCELAGAPETACIYVDEVKPADPLAPMAPDFVRATFPNGSYSGTVTFALPVKNISKTDLSGQVAYVIKANGEEIASGSAAPGAEVSSNYSATASGEVTFSCVASQGTHVGKAASEVIYIGNDTPAAPKNVKLTPITVSWDAVTTGAHNGYIDAAKVTYTVKINGDIVAEGITATSCKTNLPVNVEIKNYVAEVTATCNGLTSAAGSSNDIMFGQPFNVPASFEPGLDQADLFTIIDNNNDGKVWTFTPATSSAPNCFKISYNTRLDMDDYLILPPVKITETARLHRFSFDAWAGSSSFPEKVEVWIGRENTAEAMTTKIIDTTVLDTRDVKNLSAYFQFPETGKWYVAVKGVSDKDQLSLSAGNFRIEVSDVAVNGPAAVENLTATAATEGALKATVKFNLPTKDNNGVALTGNVTATVGTEVDCKTVSGAAGSAQSVEVTTIQGDNEITVQSMQGDVMGFPVSTTVYTGVDAPGAVNNFTMTPTEDNYGVSIKFDAPETGANGGYINKDGLQYALYQYVQVGEFFGFPIMAWQKVTDIDGTSFEGTLLSEGTALASYTLGIAASNVAGDGEVYGSSVLLGKPHDMPVIEDISKGTITYQPLMVNDQGGMEYNYLTAEALEEINPAYATDGAAIIAQGGDDQFGYWTLPTVSTKGANKAALDISYYVGACKNVTVYAEAYGTGRVELFSEADLFGYGQEGFQTLPIQLPAQFQDKNWVNITIRCDFSDEKSDFVWNGYKMINMVQKDMAAVDVKAPKKVATGTDYDVTVNVANYGLSAANAYNVELYANGEKVAEKAGAELASYAEAQVVFAQTMSPIATEDINYTAKIVQAGDANTANNETAVVAVSPKQSALPGATELTAANSENSVALTWNEPDLTAVTPDPITDDFESGDAFAAEYGDWVFVDLDEEAVGGFQGTDIPGITIGETTGSFWIWDQSQLGNQSFAAHSGTKYLFSLFSYQDNQVDNWAISPQLYGGEQTVSFWARSYSADYPEKIEVYYSTGSTDPKDFVLIEDSKVDVLPAEWNEYSVDLPEGATRFAIRSYAAGSFMLMVDDVTYTPAAAFSGEISLKGYDVYRDGVKLNDAPVENTEYADANVVEGTEYKYVVVALFDEGTGRVSNTAKIKFEKESGLESLGAAKAIATAKNTIIVRGFAGEKVIVSSADGKVIANGEASEISSISVPAGVYVVKAGNKSVKVVVK